MNYRTVYANVKVQVFISEDDIEDAMSLATEEGRETTEDAEFARLVDYALDEQISGPLKMRGYDLLPQ